MATPFNLMKSVRLASPEACKTYLAERGVVIELKPEPTQARRGVTESIVKEIRATDEATRTPIELDFQDFSVFTDTDAMTVLVQELQECGVNLSEEFDRLESAIDRAMWARMHYPQAFDRAVRFAQTDERSRGRYCYRRTQLPVSKSAVSPATVRKLATNVSAFFDEHESRGRHYAIEHWQRYDDRDYYFVYLSDRPDQETHVTEDNQLERRPRRPCFEVIFIHDPAKCVLEVCVHGGKPVYQPLQHIFSRTILGKDPEPETDDDPPFNLNVFFNSTLLNDIDPADCIESARIRMLRLSVIGRSRRRIILEGDPNGPCDDVYRMMKEFLRKERLPQEILNITQARINFRFRPESPFRSRSFTFDVTHPNTSNLKSCRTELQSIGEKYLRRWGVDRA